MLRRITAALALLTLIAVGSVDAQEPADDRPGIAVLRFDNGGSHGANAEPEDYEALEVGLQQMLLTELSQNPALRVVERARIAELMAEQDFGASGRVDVATAARIGLAVGARYMVIGSFFDIAGLMRVDLRVINAETTELVTAAGSQRTSLEMIALLIELADEISTSVDLPPLSSEAREEREEAGQAATPEAIFLYSNALLLIEEGLRDEGIASLERVIAEFPDWEEPRVAYEQERARG